MSSDSRSAYEKNTRAQFEALGRFVEAFELMVHEVRTVSISLLSTDAKHSDLISIPFYHLVMTAKPLFEIMRGIISQLVNNAEYRKHHRIDELDRRDFMGVLGEISDEYSNLVEMRNNLLHGTWFIGYSHGADMDSLEFHLHRGKINKHGLSFAENLPKDAEELKRLAKRCEEARTWICTLAACMRLSSVDLKIKDCFERSGKKWVRIWPSRETLPPTFQ